MLDNLIVQFDRALRTLAVRPTSIRSEPGDGLPEADLSASERQHVAALMRINHVGEVCAQALYQGQALTARDDSTRAALEHAADEEVEHLAWTLSRIEACSGRTSALNPVWYGGALAIGVAAGLLGDRWSLGFLAETEQQVSQHLAGHLDRLPAGDAKSRAVLDQMKVDESGHAALAERLGGEVLPLPVRLAMKAASRVMTSVAYRV